MQVSFFSRSNRDSVWVVSAIAPKKFLQAYVEDYIIQEIQAEGLVRNLAAFSRFLEAASYSNSEMVNYANIARDCGVDAKTIKGYFEILKDTLNILRNRPL